MVEVGAQRMFEKLIALDEDEYSMYDVATPVKEHVQQPVEFTKVQLLEHLLLCRKLAFIAAELAVIACD